MGVRVHVWACGECEGVNVKVGVSNGMDVGSAGVGAQV